MEMRRKCLTLQKLGRIQSSIPHRNIFAFCTVLRKIHIISFHSGVSPVFKLNDVKVASKVKVGNEYSIGNKVVCTSGQRSC